MGVPASYWRDLAYYHPADQFSAMTLPTLVPRDYQVTEKDFRRFEEAVANRSYLTFYQNRA